MTATYPRRAGLVLRGVVYGFDLLDHASVMADAPRIVPNDYIGQTTQRGRGRENQHRDDKPWSDLIVGSPRTLWEADCTGRQLNEQERHFIQDGPDEARPRMNWKLNEDNPHQIPKWVQLEQRHERDRKFGRPLWQPPEQRPRESLLEWQTPQSPSFDRASPVRQRTMSASPKRPWSPVRKRIVGWGATWLVSVIVLWTVGLLRHWGDLEQTAILALVAPVPPVVTLARWTFLGFPLSERAWKRAAGKARAARRRRVVR